MLDRGRMAGLGERFQYRFRDGYVAGPPTPPIGTRVEGVKNIFVERLADLDIGVESVMLYFEGFWSLKQVSLKYDNPTGLRPNADRLDVASITIRHRGAAYPYFVVLKSGEINDHQSMIWSGTLEIEGAWELRGSSVVSADNAEAGTDLVVQVLAEKLHQGRGT
jgi:hypothetical protein